MFTSVHHVHYVVRNRDAMVAYIDKNFGLKPVTLADHPGRGKDAMYKVGTTLIELTEPLDPNSAMAKSLARNGPGVWHVAWRVPSVRKAAKDLAAKGNKLRGQGGLTQSPRGYTTVNIEPDSSLGVWFQLAQGAAKE
jgi:catechol 2,3-dioxygenase-like lactoylglutathione lyase family enzyme